MRRAGTAFLREIIDGDLECAEMTAGTSDLSFRHRKIRHSRRRDGRRRCDQHGDVEMLLEKVAGFDGNFVAAADQNDAAALQLTYGTGGTGSAATASSAARFGPDRAASLDHPGSH